MPWKPSDSRAKTKKADSPAKQKKWSAVANAVLEKTGDDATAIKVANSSLYTRYKGGPK